MTTSVLYIVATPIGNLDDITLRAIDTLKSVDIILAEDTRHSKRLLNHFGISCRLESVNSQNEVGRLEHILTKLSEGKEMAFIVDAGTPLISDPGGYLVRAIREAGHKIVPIPGVSALTCALSASGRVNKRFCFEGFLSSKSSNRKKELTELKDESRSMIFYEAPHRIIESLEDMGEIFGLEREITLAKELTKTFETIIDGEIQNIINWLKEDEPRQKGEFVLIVDGNKDPSDNSDYAKIVLDKLMAVVTKKQAVALTHDITHYNKNELYNWSLNKP